jgi:polyphenol oxidase
MPAVVSVGPVTQPLVPLLSWAAAPALGAAAAVTTRQGGVSSAPYDSLNLGLHVGDEPDHVIINRQRAAHTFGVALRTMVFAEQVHGVGVTVVGADDEGRGIGTVTDAVPGTDILVTISAGTTLVIMVADCVPLALLDAEAGVLAAVHAGWRGTSAGAAGEAVAAMVALGARPERMAAYIGPAVRGERYQVTAEVTDGLAGAVAPDALGPGVARPDGPGHWLVDLVAANRQQLERAGLDPARIEDSGTSTADGRFFSDRAARPCGRFALLARLLSPPR